MCISHPLLLMDHSFSNGLLTSGPDLDTLFAFEREREGFPKLGVPTIMENQMEKKTENEMETGNISGVLGIRASQN